jgi:hypothetical protein
MSATTLATMAPQYMVVFGENKIRAFHVVVKSECQFIAFWKGFARQRFYFFVHLR